MSEIEIKILGIDPAQVVTRLEALGARAVFAGRVTCLHFDREQDPLEAQGRIFRLRRWVPESGFDAKFEICTKGPKQVIDGCKVREELETTVADPDTFEAIARALGYHVTMDNEKRRRSYEWNGIHVDLDEYPQVEPYMEIEGPDGAAIDRAVAELGLQNHERSTESGEELFQRLWPHVDYRHLKF